MKQSRRDVLRTGAGLATASVLTGLAGCSSIPVVGGGGGGGAFYRQWLVAPDSVDLGDHYTFSGLRPGDMDGNDEFSDTDAFDAIEGSVEADSALGPTDVDFASIDTMTAYGSGIYVATGSFTVEDVASELDDNDYDEEDELDSGQRVFLSEADSAAFAVDSSTIVAVHGGQSGSGGIEPPEEPSAGASVQEDVRSIQYGETVTGELDTGDPSGRRGNYEPITFQGSEGDVVTIDMVSDDDTYLFLDDPDGNEVASNDDRNIDGEYSLDSRIGEYTLEQSGEYTIIATSFSYSDTFTYRLSLNLARSPDDLVDTAETILGVQNGDTESYESANENIGPLVDALGGGPVVYGSTFEEEDGDDPENGILENSVAKGLTFSFGDGEFNITGAVVYEDEGDVDDGDIEDWASDGTALANGEIDDVETSTNGRVGTFSGVADYDELLSSGGPSL
jgi:hypothetical protein